jgi:antitoxin (DNA-binding transcriptional repressor) of toxin-antitoxin stability system
MTCIAANEFCERLDEVLERTQAGESFEIVRDSVVVARLEPIGGRRRWVPVQDFTREFATWPRLDWETFKRDVREDPHIDQDPFVR